MPYRIHEFSDPSRLVQKQRYVLGTVMTVMASTFYVLSTVTSMLAYAEVMLTLALCSAIVGVVLVGLAVFEVSEFQSIPGGRGSDGHFIWIHTDSSCHHYSAASKSDNIADNPNAALASFVILLIALATIGITYYALDYLLSDAEEVNVLTGGPAVGLDALSAFDEPPPPYAPHASTGK